MVPQKQIQGSLLKFLLILKHALVSFSQKPSPGVSVAWSYDTGSTGLFCVSKPGGNPVGVSGYKQHLELVLTLAFLHMLLSNLFLTQEVCTLS